MTTSTAPGKPTKNQVDVNNEFTSKERFLIKSATALIVLGIITFVVSVFLFKNAETYDRDIKINSGKFGDFGSFIGGSVGALWSLVGVLLFYVTLRLQRKELGMQREELKMTRDELAGQKTQMIQQNLTLTKQQFDNTFFQLLTLYNSIVNSLDIRKSSTKVVTASGRDCFEVFYQHLQKNLINILSRDNRFSNSLDFATIDETIEAYDDTYSTYKSDMSHYFRTIYHIFKFIDKSNIESKKQYIAITRAQLSSYEQALIFYNCLHGNGKEKFKPLIERYAIFKNIDTSLVINEAHLKEYTPSAYGK